MATPMISKEWPRFVLPIIRKEWEQSMNAVPSPLMSLLGVSGSTSSVEYSQGIGTFGLVPEYNSATAEGEPAALHYDSIHSMKQRLPIRNISWVLLSSGN